MLPLLALLGSLPLSTTRNDDWPGWRGPRGDGTTEDAPPVEWSEAKNVRWKVALPGHGLSSPIVSGERVFVTAAVPTGKKQKGEVSATFPEPFELEEQSLVVLAFARADGKELWRKQVSQAMPHEQSCPENGYATPTPTTDGTRVYCSFGSLGVYALTLAGELAWQVDLGDMSNKGHGEGSSPLFHDGGLFVLWAHWGASFLIRLDPATGKELWRTPMPEGNNCSTPLVVHVGGKDQIVVAGREVIACDPSTGRKLWSFGDERPDGITSMASPVAMDELVVVPSVNRRDLRALIATTGEEPAEELWSSRSSDNIPSPVLHHGKVVLLKGDAGQLTLLDSTSGKAAYGPERLQGVSEAWASPVVAHGRLYVIGRDGRAEVLALEPEVKSLAVNTLDEQFDASPAVAGSELYLRGRSRLYCVAAPEK